MGWKIIEIKICLIIYIIYNESVIINIIVLKKNVAQVFWVQFVVIKNNYTMIKLSLMISHKSFMTNGWNVPHHVLNNYCPKEFIRIDFRDNSHFYHLWLEY